MSQIVGAVLALVFSTSALAAESASLRDRVYTFLDQNVAKRKQKVSVEGTIFEEGEKFLVTFDALVTWGAPEKTEEGLVITETREIKQSNTKLDKDGKPTGETFKTDRTVVHRHALTERKSTASLVGLTTVVSNTLEDPTGKGFISMIELSADGKELYLYESMAAFVETSLDGRNIVPAAAATESTLFLDKGGLLQTNQTLKFYKVNVNKNFEREEVYRFNLHASEVK